MQLLETNPGEVRSLAEQIQESGGTATACQGEISQISTGRQYQNFQTVEPVGFDLSFADFMRRAKELSEMLADASFDDDADEEQDHHKTDLRGWSLWTLPERSIPAYRTTSRLPDHTVSTVRALATAPSS